VRGEAASTDSILGKSGLNIGKLDPQGPAAQSPNHIRSKELCCPECGSRLLYKDGLRYSRGREDPRSIQRWLCRDCGYRFSGPCPVGVRGFKSRPVQTSEDIYRHPNASEGVQNVDRQILNCRSALPSSRQVCEFLTEGSKNLATVDTTQQTKEQDAGTTEKDVKGKIFEFLWHMQKQNYSEETIYAYSSALRNLIKNKADLFNPENVKEFLARIQVGEARKHVIAAAYTLFLAFNKMAWDPPKYHVNRKLPFIPRQEELNDLIMGCGKKTGAYLQMLKETAMRKGEAAKLRWIDVDLARKTITLNNPEKNGNPRIFNISNKLVSMLNSLQKKNEHVFGTPNKVTRATIFYKKRKALAHRLGNPRLLQISLHTFRHWKATMLYHETKNPMLVKEFLGHRNLDTTLLYIQLEKALFQTDSDEFMVKAVKDPEEIKGLLEVGYEYICTKDDLLFFRKRK